MPRICEKHGILRKQRYRNGIKCGTRCAECDREYCKQRRMTLTPEQREREAAAARRYRASKLSDEQKQRYRKRAKEARKQMPEEERKRRTRRAYLKHTYGITIEEYESLLAEQGGICPICEIAPGEIPLDVDHCHKTGRIRGLLCNACNLGLGKLGDDVERVSRALAYLKRPVENDGK